MTDSQVERLIDAFERIGTGLNNLGNGNAVTEMGAIEFLSTEIKDGLASISNSIETLSESIAAKVK